MTVTYDMMNDRLLELVPTLIATHERWLDVNDGDPVDPHILYGYLADHVRAVLSDGDDVGDLTPVLAFVEELAQNPDEDVLAVVEVTIVEGLLDTFDEDILKRTITLMGPTTRRFAHEVASTRRHCEQIRLLLGSLERAS